MNDEKVKALRRQGFGFVCSMCTRMHVAADKGIIGCGQMSCGGPISLRDFPLYEGPLKGSLAKFCFACGEESDGAAEVNGNLIGVCAKHMPMLDRHNPENRMVPVVG